MDKETEQAIRETQAIGLDKIPKAAKDLKEAYLLTLKSLKRHLLVDKYLAKTKNENTFGVYSEDICNGYERCIMALESEMYLRAAHLLGEEKNE